MAIERRPLGLVSLRRASLILIEIDDQLLVRMRLDGGDEDEDEEEEQAQALDDQPQEITLSLGSRVNVVAATGRAEGHG